MSCVDVKCFGVASMRGGWQVLILASVSMELRGVGFSPFPSASLAASQGSTKTHKTPKQLPPNPSSQCLLLGWESSFCSASCAATGRAVTARRCLGQSTGAEVTARPGAQAPRAVWDAACGVKMTSC